MRVLKHSKIYRSSRSIIWRKLIKSEKVEGIFFPEIIINLKWQILKDIMRCYENFFHRGIAAIYGTVIYEMFQTYIWLTHLTIERHSLFMWILSLLDLAMTFPREVFDFQYLANESNYKLQLSRRLRAGERKGLPYCLARFHLLALSVLLDLFFSFSSWQFIIRPFRFNHGKVQRGANSRIWRVPPCIGARTFPGARSLRDCVVSRLFTRLLETGQIAGIDAAMCTNGRERRGKRAECVTIVEHIHDGKRAAKLGLLNSELAKLTLDVYSVI